MAYYAVKQGRIPGIYNTWEECCKQVHGFPNACYKKFADEAEAKKFVYGTNVQEFKLGVPGKGKSLKRKMELCEAAFKLADKGEDVIVINPDCHDGTAEVNSSTVFSALPSDVISLYTDGACSGNPGKGGYGYAVLVNDALCLKGSGGLLATTNNQMELTSVIEGLKVIPQGYSVVIYSDSAYVVNAFKKDWISSWKRNNWIKSDGKPVANRELWEALLELISLRPSIQFAWVKGHAGNKYNDLCDRLAVSAIDNLR